MPEGLGSPDFSTEFTDENPLLSVIREQAADVLDVSPDRITPEALIVDDLGAGSLELIELVEALEEAIGIRVDDEELEGIETIQDVLDTVVRKTNDQQS